MSDSSDKRIQRTVRKGKLYENSFKNCGRRFCTWSGDFWCENIVGENQQEPEQLNDIEKRWEKKKEIYYFGTKGEEMKHKGKILYALFVVAVITLVFVGNVILG